MLNCSTCGRFVSWSKARHGSAAQTIDRDFEEWWTCPRCVALGRHRESFTEAQAREHDRRLQAAMDSAWDEEYAAWERHEAGRQAAEDGRIAAEDGRPSREELDRRAREYDEVRNNFDRP